MEMLRTMARQTSECGMLPEQVWDVGDLPERELYNGKPTGSSMPLAWAHAEYIKLLRSLHDGHVFDMPQTTVRRYLEDKRSSGVTLWTRTERRTWIRAGRRFRVMTGHPGVVSWHGPNGSGGEAVLTARPFGFFTATLETSALMPKAKFSIEIAPQDGEAERFQVSVRE